MNHELNMRALNPSFKGFFFVCIAFQPHVCLIATLEEYFLLFSLQYTQHISVLLLLSIQLGLYLGRRTFQSVGVLVIKNSHVTGNNLVF